MPNFSDANFAVFSMSDWHPSRTPMWKFGLSKLGDRWNPVALPPNELTLQAARKAELACFKTVTPYVSFASSSFMQ